MTTGASRDRIDRAVTLSSVTLPLHDRDQRREGAHRPAAADDRGRVPVRRDPHRGRPRGPRLQLQQAGRRAGPVRPRPRGRPGPHRRGPQRHRPAVDQARLGRRVGRAAAARRPRRSPRSTSRCGTSRPSAPACRWPSCSAPTATRCAATTPRAASCTSPSSGCWTTPRASLRRRHRRHQDQGRAPVARRSTCARVRAVREHLGDDVPLMVDANQQWDRPTAQRVGRALEEFGLVWIEEPLDAYDAEGHAALARVARHRRSPPARCSPASPSTTS